MIDVITFFIIGIIVLALKLAGFAFKAAWGITKAVLCVIGLPLLLVGLFVAGLVSLAIPLLLIGLLGVFLVPVFKS